MINATVAKNAQNRYNKYLGILTQSELTIAHYTAGEDHCCVDVPEASLEKKRLAKKIAITCIDEEISGHSMLWIILHWRKIARLTKEMRAVYLIN